MVSGVDTEVGAHRRQHETGTHRRRHSANTRRPQHYPISEILHIPDETIPSKILPVSGWRKLTYVASFRHFNPGESRIERHYRDLRDQIVRHTRSRFVIGVVSGKGGVGKTTMTACIGAAFRESRSEHVVAIDAAPGFGTLAARIDAAPPDGYTEILNKVAVHGYTDIREHLGENSIGLEVLAGNPTSDQPRPLVPMMLSGVLSSLGRTHQVIVIDTADNLEHPVMRAVFDACDSLVFVSGLTRDTSLPVARSIDLLRSMGYQGLVSRSMVILNDSRNHYNPDTRRYLTDLFTESEMNVEFMPYDPHLARGAIIDIQHRLRKKNRLRLFEITASLATQHHGRADQLDH